MSCCTDCRKGVTGKLRRARCESCYRKLLSRLKQEGSFVPLKRRAMEHPGGRVLRGVAKDANGCWLWTGPVDMNGYARCWREGGRTGAHRAVYEFLVEPIPAGAELDHLCHTRDEECAGGRDCQHRRCVNPEHLEPVPGSVNNARGNGPAALNTRKTHCSRGHEFTSENTYWQPNGGRKPSRRCRECDRLKAARYQSARKS